jgi:uncharacterized protein YcsI (UPF0317 family)
MAAAAGSLPHADDSPGAWRQRMRAGQFSGPTSGLAAGYAQANLVVLPAPLADDFEAFCHANPQPCPLLERLPDGSSISHVCAPGADLRTDLPRYQIFDQGQATATPTDATPWWCEELTAFLVGCSFSFEHALQQAGIRQPHIDQGRNVSMYRTATSLRAVGPFGGTMVVSMRWIATEQVAQAQRITAAYQRMHGAPVHIGDPAALGIADLSRPDYGDAVTQPPGTVPVFWACGVTTQVAALAPRQGRVITHAPGHMLVLDLRHDAFTSDVSAV